MQKQFMLLSFFLTVFLGVRAQNFKNESAPVNYLSIPTIVQNESVNTYYVVVNANESQLNQLGYNAGSIGDKLTLRAFTRVDDLGENKIVFRFGGYGNLSGNVSSRTASDGKVSYYYNYSYSLPVSYEIYAGAIKIASGDIKIDKNQTNGNITEPFAYSSKWFPSSTAVNEFWDSPAGRSEVLNHIKANFELKVAAFVKTVRDQIDYQEYKDFAKFGYFKTTKKENFSEYENAAESAKRALASLVVGQSRTDLRLRLDSAITFWKNKMTTLDPANKEQDKLFFACANNLATAYHWLDKGDSAMYYIEQAQKADVREGYLSLLKNEIENRRKQLDVLKENGVDPYTGPAPASEQEINDIKAKIEKQKKEKEAEIAARIAAAEKAAAPVIETYDGYIINREDKKLTGKFKCYKENNGEKTGKNYFVENGSQKEVEISPSFIKVCEYDSKKFELVRYIDASGLGKETSLLPVVYESDKIKVYKQISPIDNSYRTLSFIYYKRPTEDVATNTSNLAFTTIYKKNLSKYFNDCPTVASKALAGEYTDDDEMRIAAAIDYTNCK